MAERKRFKADVVPSSSVGGGISSDQRVMRQTNDHTKVAKKRVLIDELTTPDELYNDLKLRRSLINSKISELKRERRAIREEAASLKDKCFAKLAALEELGAESHDTQEELAKSVISEAEVMLANYRRKIIGEEDVKTFNVT